MTGAGAVDLLTSAARSGAVRPLLLDAAAVESADRRGTRQARPSGTASRAFWNELYLELRRQAGDERLPASLRRSLRGLANQAFTRATRDANPGLPRRVLRDALPVTLSDDLVLKGKQQALSAAVDLDRPLVLLEVRNRPDVLTGAVDLLVARGFEIIRIGGGAFDRFPHPAVIDLVATRTTAPALELLLLSRASFVISGGASLQQVSYLFDTPSLTLNALDPFACYPVRVNGVFLLRAALDVDSGRDIPPSEQFGDLFFRNRRNIGWREHSAAEVTAAVSEMLEGPESGWRDTSAQVQYREHAATAGATLANTIRYIREVGPENGFLGDGRLARVQAEQIA